MLGQLSSLWCALTVTVRRKPGGPQPALEQSSYGLSCHCGFGVKAERSAGQLLTILNLQSALNRMILNTKKTLGPALRNIQ